MLGIKEGVLVSKAFTMSKGPFQWHGAVSGISQRVGYFTGMIHYINAIYLKFLLTLHGTTSGNNAVLYSKSSVFIV